MKVKILSLALLLVIMAVIPLAATKCKENGIGGRQASTADIVEKPTQNIGKNTAEEEIICGLIAGACPDSYSEETIKAAAVIINTNYKLDKNSFDLSDTNVYKDINTANDDTMAKIKKAYNSIKELYAYIDNKIAAVPYSRCSNGNTVNSDKYAYIKAVASPWDISSENFSTENICEGVSLDGLDYLCKNGATAIEALGWYVPKIEIK